MISIEFGSKRCFRPDVVQEVLDELGISAKAYAEDMYTTHLLFSRDEDATVFRLVQNIDDLAIRVHARHWEQTARKHY